MKVLELEVLELEKCFEKSKTTTAKIRRRRRRREEEDRVQRKGKERKGKRRSCGLRLGGTNKRLRKTQTQSFLSQTQKFK